MTQTNARPPTFVLFCSDCRELPEAYVRYLVNGLREAFGFRGTPIRIHLRRPKIPDARHFKSVAGTRRCRRKSP